MNDDSLITPGCPHAHSSTYMQNTHITHTCIDKHWKQKNGLSNAENLKMSIHCLITQEMKSLF